MKKTSFNWPLFALLSCLLFPVQDLRAEVKLPGLFSDHMVLQREAPVPIWGTATPGARVIVQFAGQKKSVVVAKNGSWKISLDSLPVNAVGQVLRVSEKGKAGTHAVEITDVLVGEVWVGSGQSNMAGGAGGYAQRDEVLAKNITEAPYPGIRLFRIKGGGPWREALDKDIRGFSALLFSFGLKLHQELKVPVGLMVGAVGGTASGRWLSLDMMQSDKAVQSEIKDFAATHSLESLKKEHEAQMLRWESAVAKAKAEGVKRLPRRPGPLITPGNFSNRKIGDLYAAHIKPALGYRIRGVLWDQGESGTGAREVDQVAMMGALIKGWRTVWNQGEFPFIYMQKPSGGGCAWETEGNPVTRMADAFVPLPEKPNPKDDGEYRERHIRIMRYPKTAMAIANDLGSGVHPNNKSGYGARAARVALGMVYGKPIEVYGPVYRSHEVKDGKIRIRFDHVGKGLAFRHGETLQGFALAGEDRVFQWADAVVEGDTVVASSELVSHPVAVRYGWSRSHPWANLFNQDGLPALTFRSDQW